MEIIIPFHSNGNSHAIFYSKAALKHGQEVKMAPFALSFSDKIFQFQGTTTQQCHPTNFLSMLPLKR